MPSSIESYALVGDTHTAALIDRGGSIDWLCFPRFDSASVFGAILGDENHGRWLLAPAHATDPAVSATRSYLEDTFTLVTRWVTPTGEVEVTDFMPIADRRADLVRRVRGISGSVMMHVDLRLRFDYARSMPWIRQNKNHEVHELLAVAGPDAVVIRGPKMVAEDHNHTAEFSVQAGETVDFTMTWYPSHRDVPDRIDVTQAFDDTNAWWEKWASSCVASPQYVKEVHRSLLVLRALTHEDTGGIVAAATTSLPESFGGSRNWDYRYVWLRDASLTLNVLIEHGFEGEADSWRNWLLRALAGDPSEVQIVYGLGGERRLVEWELDTLPGYQGAAPARVGNAAFRQYQGDVFGEVMVALRAARELGADEPDFSWPLQRSLMNFVEENWRRPDKGIWEVRGDEQHFTHSRAMLWAAFDCAISAVKDHGLDGPLERWEGLRDEIREEIETKGFDSERNTFTQYYGSSTVDAALLQLPQIGFIAADDARMLGTVAAIESELIIDGLLLRYRTDGGADGLAGDEAPFLACSFWLVEQYARSGRIADARKLMDRLVGLSNDVGLLSEEYDVARGRQAGNTPQALTHLTLVRAADAISAAES